MAHKSVSDENKTIARHVATIFGGKPRMQQYLDEAETSEIAILICEDQPDEGVASFATVGLSDYPIPDAVLKPPLGVEIVGASPHPEFAAALSTAAFCVINSEWVAEPGRIFPSVVGIHIADTTVPHLMFVNPFPWEDALDSIELETKTIAWVLGLPISEAELEFVRENGADVLEDLFEKANIDVYDLYRPSVV